MSTGGGGRGVGDGPSPSPLGSASTRHSRKVKAFVSAEHEVATLAAAKQYQLESVPSRIVEGGQRRRLPMCTPTGRFCPCAAWFDPFREGTVSDLSPYGAGITSYFKTVKLFVWLFAILTLVALVPLSENANSPVPDNSALGLGSTTLGHLASHVRNATEMVVFPAGGSGPDGKYIASVHYGLNLYVACELLACIVFACAMVSLWSGERREKEQVIATTVTVEDYSVWVRSLPATATEEEVKDHFERVAGAAIEDTLRPRDTWISRVTSRRRWRVAENLQPTVASVALIKDNMNMVHVFLERGKYFARLRRIGEEMAFLRLCATQHPDLAGGGACTSSIDTQLKRLKRQRDQLLASARDLVSRAKQLPSCPVLGAFVTFQDARVRDAVMTSYGNGRNGFVRYLCMPSRLRFQGQRLRVTSAPAPSTILWQNLNKSMANRVMRRTFTTALTALVMLVSFVLLVVTGAQQQKFQQGARSDDCVRLGPAAWPAGYVNATQAALLSLPTTDPRLYCWCQTVGYDAMAETAIRASPFVDACPAQVCPRLFSLNPTAVDSSVCIAWLRDKSISTLLVVASSAAIVGVNTALAAALRALSVFESHHTLDGLNASLGLRLALAMFVNTGVLLLLINSPAAHPLVNLIPDLRVNSFDDFHPEWYTSVGMTLMTTMLVNIFSSHLFTLVMYAKWKYSQVTIKLELWRTPQRRVNEVFVGPSADYAYRIAQLYNAAFVCFVFGSLLPMLTPIAFASSFVSYWMDKLFFLRYFRRPPAYGNHTQRTVSRLMPLALVLRIMVSIWALSHPFFGAAVGLDPVDARRIVTNTLASLPSHFVNQRVSQSMVTPLTVALVLVVAIIALGLVFTFLSSAAIKLFHLVTCGCFNAASAMLRRSLVSDDGLRPTYSAALAAVGSGSPTALQGLPGYSMLDNPILLAAFGITPEFAKLNRNVSGLGRFGLALRRGAAGSYLDVTMGEGARAKPTDGDHGADKGVANAVAPLAPRGVVELGGRGPPPLAYTIFPGTYPHPPLPTPVLSRPYQIMPDAGYDMMAFEGGHDMHGGGEAAGSGQYAAIPLASPTAAAGTPSTHHTTSPLRTASHATLRALAIGPAGEAGTSTESGSSGGGSSTTPPGFKLPPMAKARTLKTLATAIRAASPRRAASTSQLTHGTTGSPSLLTALSRRTVVAPTQVRPATAGGDPRARRPSGSGPSQLQTAGAGPPAPSSTTRVAGEAGDRPSLLRQATSRFVEAVVHVEDSKAKEVALAAVQQHDQPALYGVGAVPHVDTTYLTAMGLDDTDAYMFREDDGSAAFSFVPPSGRHRRDTSTIMAMAQLARTTQFMSPDALASMMSVPMYVPVGAAPPAPYGLGEHDPAMGYTGDWAGGGFWRGGGDRVEGGTGHGGPISTINPIHAGATVTNSGVKAKIVEFETRGGMARPATSPLSVGAGRYYVGAGVAAATPGSAAHRGGSPSVLEYV